MSKEKAIISAEKLYNDIYCSKDNKIEFTTNLDKVLEHLDMKVILYDPIELLETNPELSRSLKPIIDASGFLMIKDDKGKIFVDKTQSTGRKRFTIAHEIGHYYLKHFSSDSDSDIVYRDNISSLGVNPNEIEANSFAAELLMPRFLVEILHEFEYSISEMAVEFGVSYESMRFRLKNLHLL